MKAIIRVPTVQFGYIEVEVPSRTDKLLSEWTDEVITVHNEFIAAYEKTRAEVQKLKDDNF